MWPHSSKLVVICVILSLFVLFLFVLFSYYLCCSMYCLCVNVPALFQISCYFCYSVVVCAVLLLLCFTVLICVVLLLFVLFYVLCLCKCVLYHCHRVFTQLQLTNLSYHIISYHIISYLTNGTIFEKKVTQHKMRILIFSTTTVREISHSKKNLQRYHHKCNWAFVKGTAIPLQTRTGPECSSRLRFPDFKTFGT